MRRHLSADEELGGGRGSLIVIGKIEERSSMLDELYRLTSDEADSRKASR